MYKPIVSIVMPVYNAGIFLKDAIQDLLRQTCADFEMICVDDGSEDQSPRVLEYFAARDERLRVIKQEHQGAGAARNRGLELARGKYLLFLDSDDRFETGMIEKALIRAENTAADIVVFNALGFDSWTGIIHEGEWVRKELLPKTDPFNASDHPDGIFVFTPSCVWNKLYRSEFIREKHIRFQNYPYMNDVYFGILSLASAKRVSVLEEVLVWYRQGRSTSVSSAAFKSVMPEYAFIVLDDLLDQLKEMGIYETVWKSFANHAIGILFTHLEALTVDNSGIYADRMNPKFLSRMGIAALKPREITWKIYAEKLAVLCRRGFMPFLVQWIKELKAERMENIQQGIFFDLAGIPENSRIVLYGAGFRGKSLHQMIVETRRYQLAGWVDQNAEKMGREERIVMPEKIKGMEYDHVVIAVDDIDVYQEIERSLREQGVKDDLIVW